MDKALKTIERDGYTLKIYQDDSPESPRWCDNLGTMVCWHRRYNLGDEQPKVSPEEYFRSLAAELVHADDADKIPDEHIVRIWKKHVIQIPLGLYDHSGITMYAGGGAHTFDAQGWDSGTVGVIYVTREQIIKEYGDDSAESRTKAEEMLHAEIKVYDQYLRGDAYGYVIEDQTGEQIDSCWGFFGMEYAEEEGESALTFLIAKEIKDEAECLAITHC